MHTLALGLLKQQKEPVSRASSETGTCFSATWALSEPGATMIIWKACFGTAALNAFQVSLCDRKDWDGVGFRLPQSRDCCSEERVLLLTGIHLGPIAASLPGKGGHPWRSGVALAVLEVLMDRIGDWGSHVVGWLSMGMRWPLLTLCRILWLEIWPL